MYPDKPDTPTGTVHIDVLGTKELTLNRKRQGKKNHAINRQQKKKAAT